MFMYWIVLDKNMNNLHAMKIQYLVSLYPVAVSY